MVDIKKDFGDSFNLLTHHKKIIIPVAISIIIPLILIYLFLNLSGLSPLLKQYMNVYQQYQQQDADYMNAYQQQNSGYLSVTNTTGQADMSIFEMDTYTKIFNIQNIILLVCFLFIGAVLSFYFSCMSYAIIALTIKKKPLDFGNIVSTTHKFLFKLLSLQVLMFFIIIAPLAILTIITISIFYLNTILGALSIVLFLLLFLAYTFTVGIRLIFTAPSMYLEEEGAVKSIKHSYSMTKGHLKQVLIIFAMLYGITLFMNSLIGQPLMETYSNTLFDSNTIRIAINFVILLLFVILEAFIFTFEHIYLFYSYVDFKTVEEVTK